MKQLPTGSSAPDFELKTPAGQTFQLRERMQSGPVILAFYKASCPTCQLTFPYLEKIYSATAGKSHATMLGISQDDDNLTEAFAGRFKITFPLLVDDHPHAVSSSYNLEFVPALFVVRSGVIELSDYGFSKAALSSVAQVAAEGTGITGVKLFSPDDGLPATRPG